MEWFVRLLLRTALTLSLPSKHTPIRRISNLLPLLTLLTNSVPIRETPSPLPWFRPGRCSVSKSKTASRSVHRATCPLGCLKFLIHFNALSSVPALNGFLIRHGEKCSIDRTQANSSFLVVQ